MDNDRKKIYLMICNQSTNLKQQDWLEQMPELNILADVKPVLIFNQPSADITPKIWLKLAKEIQQRFNQTDGFVILHSVDNLLYTSCALSFLLQNLTKPIVFTGVQSNKPSVKKTEIRANLINSYQAVNHQIAGVSVMFGNRLIKANQALKSNTEGSLNVFATPINVPSLLGRIDFSIRTFSKTGSAKEKTKFYTSLAEKVEVITVGPLINLKKIANQIEGCEGIAVNAEAYQNLPTDLIELLGKSGLPIVIWSKNISNPEFLPKNILLINSMTWPSALTKFLWVLTQTKNNKGIKELMNKNIAGEIIHQN
ncbi:MAG: asparaginase domain-containing protein [Patescibacteria group bacterium]